MVSSGMIWSDADRPGATWQGRQGTEGVGGARNCRSGEALRDTESRGTEGFDLARQARQGLVGSGRASMSKAQQV
jgi:hypothetical protein